MRHTLPLTAAPRWRAAHEYAPTHDGEKRSSVDHWMDDLVRSDKDD